MQKMTVNDDSFFPMHKRMPLSDLTSIDVVCYELTSQVLRLLQNDKLTRQTNLLIDIKNPNKIYNFLVYICPHLGTHYMD